MRSYDHNKIEKKWQKEWETSGIYTAHDDASKPKKYVLDMFPYPSGDGLHVGHPKGYIATDIYSRHARMNGASVLHPMGWDAFGLPAENYAIKNKVHPRKAVEKNVARFKKQLKLIGLDYDWSREINTTDPEFYKWTQWIFLKLYEKGLAYESFEPINWCPSCQTGLANEDLEGNACERCGTIVEKRPMRQWILKITEYAERMLQDLELLPEWQEHIKESQRNWIGKSEGAEIDFPLVLNDKKYTYVILHGYKGHADRPRWNRIKSELESNGHTVVVPELPNTDTPAESEQVATALASHTFDENTILVGHSLGAVVAMKALLECRVRITGLILIAPAIDPSFPGAEEKSFWKTFSWDIDYEKLQSLTGYRFVLSDLKEGQTRIEYLKLLASKLNARLVETYAQKEHFTGDNEPDILLLLRPTIRVFTTRADTLFGATFLILSPEHPWVQEAVKSHESKVMDTLKNRDEVLRYIVEASKKTEIERQENKEKTGVKLEGVEAINPATGEKIPLYVADYVLANYGTGAIMAVPAHDERDHEFAKKFDLPIKQVIARRFIPTGLVAPRGGVETLHRDVVDLIIEHPTDGTFLVQKEKDGDHTHIHFVGGGTDGEADEIAVARELEEETGFTEYEFTKKPITSSANFAYRHTKNKNQETMGSFYHIKLKSLQQKPSEIEDGKPAPPTAIPLDTVKVPPTALAPPPPRSTIQPT